MTTVSFHFSLVTPEKVLFDQSVRMVVIPGIKGDIGVLKDHAPLLTLLRPGVITIYEEGTPSFKIFVEGGFADITPEKCAALVPAGTPLEALDKRALEVEIKSLVEDIAKGGTPEERKKVNQNLTIAQTKLMEVLSSVK